MADQCNPSTDLANKFPKLLREAERRVNEHVWGDKRPIVSIPADVSRDVDILLLAAADEIERLDALVNSPETADFLEGVKLESAHQRERWGAPHDREKSAEHWYWLVGYLAGKALRAAITGDVEKAKHHTISSAAALAHWHTAISQDETRTGVGRDADLQAHDNGRQAHETAPVSI